MKMQLSCGCCDNILSGLVFNRLCKIVGPLNDDTTLSEYTEPWVEVSAEEPRSWAIVIDKSDAPQVPSIPGVNEFNEWVRYCKPLRFRIGTPLVDSSLSDGIDIIAAESDLNVPLSGEMIPHTSHFRGLFADRLTLPVPVRALTALPDALFDQGSFVSHLRVWIDGVDVTGVIAAPEGATFTLNQSGTLFSGSYVSTPDPLEIEDITIRFLSECVVEWDVWIISRHAGTSPLTGVYNGFITASGSFAHYISDEPVQLFKARVNAVTNRVSARVKFKLTVPEDSAFLFGGTLHTIILEEQSGWVYAETVLLRTLSNAVSGDVVSLRLDKEIPEIILESPYSLTPLLRQRFRFQPRGIEYDEWAYFQNGTWHGESPRVFELQGSEITEIGEWLSFARFESDPDSFFTADCPLQITVERVTT